MARKRIAILWRAPPGAGGVTVVNGAVAGDGAFELAAPDNSRLELDVHDARVRPGANATRVSVRTGDAAFTFFLRDANRATPVFIPEYGVAVTEAADRRSFAEVAEAVRAAGLRSDLQRFTDEPEESFEQAAAANRDLVCPTWLGLGRDMRIFEVRPHDVLGYGYWGTVQPRYHRTLVSSPETGEYEIQFRIGPGSACRVDIARRLDDGVLPILHSVQREDEMAYRLTLFATLATQPLEPGGVRGSDWRCVYPHSCGSRITDEERETTFARAEAEARNREEETVCCIRVEAVNEGRTPRYAWFGRARLGPRRASEQGSTAYDGKRGLSLFPDGRAFAVHRLNDRPMPDEEAAVLVPPGGRTVFEILIPHQPLPTRRAAALAKLDVARHLAACRAFWQAKLDAAAKVRVPERAIDERIRAGLLHCDLIAFGREPGEPLMASVGVYAPIGSESSPIIQFFDAMGRHDLARRSIQFFLDRQRDDGFIQTFGHYQLETGGVLWNVGEHYRYTRDDRWLRGIAPKLLKACEFLLRWRKRDGDGLQRGKVADPPDEKPSFMLNALSYLGVRSIAECLANVAPGEARRLARAAVRYRRDLRAAFLESMAESPVIPGRDGRWIPSFPPWAGHPGPVSLYAEGGAWHTHGAFGARDSLIGALYLLLAGVLAPDEPAADFLVRAHHELFTSRNAGLSQPYYCRHDFAHLMRGEVAAFLKTYYNQMAGLQDRETYTFWEHYFGASPHKTHEESWFLMQTRWMLWKEDGDTLRLLAAIPRRWMEHGKRIELDGVASYFGPLSLLAESDVDGGRITARVVCKGKRRPRRVSVRLPHPRGWRAVAADGGSYDAGTESVVVSDFSGTAEVAVRFE